MRHSLCPTQILIVYSLWTASLLSALLPVAAAAQLTTVKPEPVPTVIVQVKFKAGAASAWREAFEKHLVPAIEEAIEKKDEITGFAYWESLTPGQPYDFMFLLHARSFAFFDRPRPFPHYRALFRRLGAEQAQKVLAEMGNGEAAVAVTLVRWYGAAR